MKRLLVVCGPTSTGKTTLAINLAKKFGGELVSADSRQVYRGVDIGTGKDLPLGSKIRYPWFSKYGYYEVSGVKVWGYDLVDPKREYSVAQYLKFAKYIIGDIGKRKKLPILVGGTGLYIKGVVDGIPTAVIPKNNNLRKNFETKSVDELFDVLASLDAIRAGSMNSSDKKNPRRLIRAIEVSQYLIDHKDTFNRNTKDLMDILFIGLNADKNFIDEKIDYRVKKRIDEGIKSEIEKLLKGGVNWDSQSMLSLGYRQWRDYFEGGVPQENVVDEWKRDEKKYVRRQLVWFKKDKRINWFDVSAKNYSKDVEKVVEKWYSSADVQEN